MLSPSLDAFLSASEDIFFNPTQISLADLRAKNTIDSAGYDISLLLMLSYNALAMPQKRGLKVNNAYKYVCCAPMQPSQVLNEMAKIYILS